MELYPSFLLLLLACYVQVTFCRRSLCDLWPMSASPRFSGKRSVEDQDMSLEQDYGITIDYGTPGPILEPHQDEYIGQEEDARKMESGQNLNREWEGLCDFTGRCKRELPPGVDEVIGEIKDEKIMESGQDLNRARRSPCRFPLQGAECGGMGRGKRSVEDQDMDKKQDNVTAILEPHQNEVIGQDQNENIMEPGQDLNRTINFCSTWCRRCTRSSWWCRSCPKCRRGKRSVGVEDQGMDQEQDAIVSPPGFAYNDLNRIMT